MNIYTYICTWYVTYVPYVVWVSPSEEESARTDDGRNLDVRDVAGQKCEAEIGVTRKKLIFFQPCHCFRRNVTYCIPLYPGCQIYRCVCTCAYGKRKRKVPNRQNVGELGGREQGWTCWQGTDWHQLGGYCWGTKAPLSVPLPQPG